MLDAICFKMNGKVLRIMDMLFLINNMFNYVFY